MWLFTSSLWLLGECSFSFHMIHICQVSKNQFVAKIGEIDGNWWTLGMKRQEKGFAFQFDIPFSVANCFEEGRRSMCQGSCHCPNLGNMSLGRDTSRHKCKIMINRSHYNKHSKSSTSNSGEDSFNSTKQGRIEHHPWSWNCTKKRPNDPTTQRSSDLGQVTFPGAHHTASGQDIGLRDFGTLQPQEG